MNAKKLTASRILQVLMVSFALAACGGDDPDKLVASAKEYLAKNDNKAAIIQIKNALQSKPDMPEGRYLLGLALLHGGDPVSAEIEFEKARQLKYSNEMLAPQLAKVWVAQGKFRKVVDEFSKLELTTPASKAELQIALSTAYAALGQADQARAALTVALQAEPNNVDALLAQARRKADTRDFDASLALIDGVIAKFPQTPEAFRLKGDILLFAKNDIPSSIAAYKQSIAIKPDFLIGYVGLLNILLQQGRLDEASTQIDALKKVAANNPQTKYFEAQYAYQRKDYKTAREIVQQVLKVAPTNIRTLQLAGAIEFQAGAYVPAEGFLSKVVQAAPEQAMARRLLTMTYLRSGQAEKALSTLSPVLKPDLADPDLLTLAGEVQLQNGNVKKAEDYFAQASKLDPKDMRKRTSLALAHMMGGDTDGAFSELQSIASADAGVTADLALISAHLRRKDYDKALKAIDALDKKQPGSPLASNLRGKTQLALKDTVGARKSFEAALKVNPTYFPAVSSLAALDFADKKPDAAKARFEGVLAQDPKNVQALLALAELRARAGGPPAEVAELIGKAVSASPTDPAPRILLIDFLLRNQDVKQATTVAQSALAALPDNPYVLDAVGRTQLAAKDTNQALTTFNKLASLQPSAPLPQMRLADAYMADKNKDGAAQSLNKALAIKPDLLDAQRGLILLDVGAERFQAALNTARSVQKQRPKEAIGYVLEGDIFLVQKKWDEAIAAFQQGLKQGRSLEPALKIHNTYYAAGRNAEGEKFAASWLKDHPKDIGFLFYLGDAALAKKDYPTAEKMYGQIVQIQPTNAPAFNNLAWVSGQLKKDGAIGFAEKANQLMPDQPAFLDTMAMLLLDKNDAAKALEWEKKAMALQPQNPIFKLNLAKIYVKTGEKTQAKPLLDELAKLGDKFSSQDEVGQILKSL